MIMVKGTRVPRSQPLCNPGWSLLGSGQAPELQITGPSEQTFLDRSFCFILSFSQVESVTFK